MEFLEGFLSKQSPDFRRYIIQGAKIRINTLPPIDLSSRSKMEYLLKLLSLERLDREGAQELRPLLEREFQNTADQRYRKVLLGLVKILDEYIRGEIDLMPGITISKVSNVG